MGFIHWVTRSHLCVQLSKQRSAPHTTQQQFLGSRAANALLVNGKGFVSKSCPRSVSVSLQLMEHLWGEPDHLFRRQTALCGLWHDVSEQPPANHQYILMFAE